MNVCSYHLQEAGAAPEEELAFALATAIAVLDDLKTKVPAFVKLWDEITRERYGVMVSQTPNSAAFVTACK